MSAEAMRGWVRYEKARKLSPAQWAELHQRNLRGENFDDMIDALPEPGDRPHPVLPIGTIHEDGYWNAAPTFKRPQNFSSIRVYAEPPPGEFQPRVRPWMHKCFGHVIAHDREERNHRFFEEAAELVQACGMTRSEAHQLVDYVYGRPAGEKGQEVGGVMVTLAALCLAQKLDMHSEAERELYRISDPAMILKIRAKQAAKPKHSPLPEAAEPERREDTE
jgi:hypothetical protein